MQREQDPAVDAPVQYQLPQYLFSKEGMTEFCARLLDYTRPYSRNDGNFVRFEKDMTAWRDKATESYDRMPKYQADQMALQFLGYMKLIWYGTLVRSKMADRKLPRTAFFDELLDSMGFKRKIQIG